MTAALLLLLAALGLAYGHVMRDLVRTWLTVPYYSYGALVPAFSAVLLWDARRDVASAVRERVRPHLSAAALGPLVAGAVLLAVGVRVNSLCLAVLSLPCVLAGAGIAAIGPARFRPFAFPVAFLALMAPLPDGALSALSLPMQYAAAWFTEHALHALRVPVTRDGLALSLEPVILLVTEACNGLRFLLAMVVIGVAVAWASQRSWRARLAVVALALATGVLANMLRVLVTAVLAHLFGAQAAMGTLHVAYGKAVYLLMLVPFGMAVLGLRRAGRRRTMGALLAAEAPATSGGGA
jgi:exosortase